MLKSNKIKIDPTKTEQTVMDLKNGEEVIIQNRSLKADTDGDV